MNKQFTIEDFQVSNGFYTLTANGKEASIHKASRGFCFRFTRPGYTNWVNCRTLKEAKERALEFINR